MPDTRTIEATGSAPRLVLPKRIRRVRCPRCGSMETAIVSRDKEKVYA